MITNVYKDILTITGLHEAKNIEIEARFKNVNRFQFERVQKYLEAGGGVNVFGGTAVNLKDERDGNIRKMTDLDTEKSMWITKEPLKSLSVQDYDLDLCISLENPIDSGARDTFNPDTIRIKKRHSYMMINDTVRVDLTVVDQTIASVSTENRFEIEVELVDHNSLDNLDAVIQKIYKIIHQTEVIYTLGDINRLISFVNGKMGGGIGGGVRHLTWNDLRWGYLVGNKLGYVVHHKAKGIRKLLVVGPGGIWMISSHLDQFNLLATDYPEFLYGFIGDGEHIPVENQKLESGTRPYWFMVYDVIATSMGDYNENRYPERIDYAQVAANAFKDSTNVYVTVPRIRELKNVDVFFTVMREYFDNADSLPSEGLVFRSIETTYQNGTVIVWKPEPTIAVSVKWSLDSNNVKSLLLYGEDVEEIPVTLNGIAVPFQFSSTLFKKNAIVDFRWAECKLVPVKSSMIDHPVELDQIQEMIKKNYLIPLRIGQSVLLASSTKKKLVDPIGKWEGLGYGLFGFDGNPEIKSGDIVTVDSKGSVRPNDTIMRPDTVREIELVKSLMKDPITWDTLRGLNLDLLRHHIDRSLGRGRIIDREDDGSTDGSTGDGSGRSVIFKNSISKYFDSKENIQYILEYLHDNNNISEITICGWDGDAVEHLFRPKIRGPTLIDVTLNPLNLKWLGSAVKVSVSGKAQSSNDWIQGDENIVRLSHFLDNGFRVIRSSRLDNEYFMHLSERKIADLWSVIKLAKVTRPDKYSIAEVATKIESIDLVPLNLEPLDIDDVEALPMTSVMAADMLYRIGCLQGNDSFYDAFLKSFYRPYQNVASDRINIMEQFRRELASTERGKTIFSDTDKNNFYLFISKICNINIFICQLSADSLLPLYRAIDHMNNRNIILIATTDNAGERYEILALKVEGLYQTIFESNHPIVKNLMVDI